MTGYMGLEKIGVMLKGAEFVFLRIPHPSVIYTMIRIRKSAAGDADEPN